MHHAQGMLGCNPIPSMHNINILEQNRTTPNNHRAGSVSMAVSNPLNEMLFINMACLVSGAALSAAAPFVSAGSSARSFSSVTSSAQWQNAW
jgi:hypothetical protein